MCATATYLPVTARLKLSDKAVLMLEACSLRMSYHHAFLQEASPANRVVSCCSGFSVCYLIRRKFGTSDLLGTAER